jgi:hypothetical protein
MSEPLTPDQRASPGAWAFALVVIASVVALVATVNTWVARQALDTDAWVEATDGLLADDDVREALAVYLVDELYEAISVEDAIADVLPSDLEGLAGLLAGAVREPATGAVDGLLATDAVADAWSQANRTAHSTLLAVIDDDVGDVLSTADGAVTIDLGEVVRSLGERIGLDSDVLDDLPDDAGVVVLFESDELEAVQDVASTVKRLSTILFVLVLALFAGAVYLSGDRRRTLRDCGIGLILVGLIVLVARIVSIDALVNNLTRADNDEPATSVLEIGSSLLRQVALTQLLIGIVLAGFAVVVGPTRVARGVRAMLAPALRRGTTSAVIGGIVVFIVLLWIKPGGPIDGWMLALGIAALCVAGVAWVQRATMAEFPDMTFTQLGTLALASTRTGIASLREHPDGDD